ncbi:hypothetical protein M2102_001889 [Fusobacterium sp. PH5-7]|uniref:hypothetical protein n=1 Tax=Fusobacterium sp. PH5-7 TaxID=2940528 RepID=UPI00247341B3|nr:hypothetical protein [Fusobacterium sp. PH5-7]MDH6458254.1 hypothetical protein [Fusobacterium sp. PH5-7]
MKLDFVDYPSLKKYDVKFIDELKEYNNGTKQKEMKMEFDLGYSKKIIEFYLISIAKEKSGTGKINLLLEELNQAFNVIMYELDEKGKISKINNQLEIIDKWNQIRKKFNETNEDINSADVVFELNGVINNRKKLEELLKRYSIIPYLYLGFHNQEINQSRPLRIEGVLYNMFLLENIPFQGEIYDESTSVEKRVKVIGKESTEFNRSKYMKKIVEAYSEISLNKLGSFELKCEGLYIYNNDNTLKEMEFKIEMEIKNIINHKCKYLVSERKK